MPIIFGLGNIGEEYELTRHNIGFELLDVLADVLSFKFTAGNGPFLVAEGVFKTRKVILVKPTTYMNRSGTAVKKCLSIYKHSLENCLVCYDDLNLPPGKIRFRSNGSAGGHNGIEDIIFRTGSKNFPRLRFGIGNDFPRGRQADYVLSKFSKDELPDIEISKKNAVDGILCFIREGITNTMNSYNKK